MGPRRSRRCRISRGHEPRLFPMRKCLASSPGRCGLQNGVAEFGRSSQSYPPGRQVQIRETGVSPYDALLDQYEPEGREAEIDVVFKDLKAFLPDFLENVLSAQAKGPEILPVKGFFRVQNKRNWERNS